MLDKKASNKLSVLAMLWVGVILLLFAWRQGAFSFRGYGTFTFWAVVIAVFFLPVLVVYSNNRSAKELSAWDQVLQLAFHLSWLGLGLVLIFSNGNALLLSYVFSFAVIILGVILIKAILSGKSHQKLTPSAKKQARPLAYAVTPPIVFDVILFGVFAWGMWLNFTDTSGWIGLFTGPLLLIVAILLVVTAIGWIVIAVRSPRRKHKFLCLLGALVTLLPILVTGFFIFLNARFEQEANQRATTPISLSEARRLVEACQVETIQRYGGGRMQLNTFGPAVLGADARRESRTFDVKYYDELFTLARRKDVEDRCGFVPTYDIERTKKPQTNKWITQAEAEAILGKCLWNTRFYDSSQYLKETDYPAGPMTTGILLNQLLSVWNDDTESTITLVKVDDQTKTALQAKQATCFGRY